MADFKKIDNARKALGLEEEASLKEIKQAYRKLSLKYHPDRCKGPDKKRCQETFQEISDASELLINYCTCYRCSFKEKDVKRNSMDKETLAHLKRFYDGWLGDLDL